MKSKSQSPPVQGQVEQSKASQAVEINLAEPFQTADLNFPKKHCGKQNREFQSKRLSEFPWPHYNEQSVYVSFAFKKMQNQIFELPRSKEICFIRVLKLEKGVGVIQGASSI